MPAVRPFRALRYDTAVAGPLAALVAPPYDVISDEARRTLARLLLERTGELTAADVAGPFGWGRRAAAAVLDEIATGRDGDGFRIWTAN